MKFPTPKSSASARIMVLSLGLLSSAAATQHAMAQEASASSEEELVVTGLRRSLENALEVKKSSQHVVEALDLADIDAIPDVTIADAIVRLPGVNGARDRGNQSQAAIRGLGPRMVFGTVNGREVASSEPGRSIRFEQYPSELVSAVQVYKSQSADLVSGGIAGTVNLETVSPLDYNGPTFTLRGGLVQYDGGEDIPDYDALGNRFSGSIIKEVNEKFGFAIGVTSQLQKNAYPSYQAWGFNSGGGQDNLPAGGGDLTGEGDFGYVPWGIQTEVKKLETQRDAIMGALQFRPSDGVELKYDALYTEFHIDEEQNQTWYQNIGNWDNGEAGGYSDATIVDNRAVAITSNQWTGDIRHVIAAYDQTNSVFSQGLNMEISAIDGWLIEADLAYSLAERENWWNAIYLDEFGHEFSYDLRGTPSATVPVGSPASMPENSDLGVDDWNEGSTLEDESLSFALDFNKTIGKGDFASIDFGFRVADREKEVIWSDYNISGGLGVQWSWDTQIPAQTSDDFFSSYTVGAIETSPFLNASSYNATAEELFGDSDFSELANVNVGRYWKVSEDTQALFVKANFEGTMGGVEYNANAGLRYVNMATESFDYDGLSIDNDASELLPSATINFFLSDEKILRASIARAISRPPLDELRAGQFISVVSTAVGGNTGNPNLEPFTSDQIDLAYEWYFAPESLAAVAIYYKQVENYIGYTSFDIPTEGGQPATVWAPMNSDEGGSIHGMELTYQMPIAAGFGIYSNYAYADSDIEEFAPADNPYPMAGLATHTATVDLWFSEGPFEARLGWKYHSGYTTGFEWDGSAIRHLDSEENVGLSLAYKLNDNVSFRLQGNNLTNQELRLSQNNDDADVRRYDVYGKTFLFDVTLKF